MPILPPFGPGGTLSFTALDIIKQAMLEIGALDPVEQPSAAEAATGIAKLNRLLDAWNADGRFIYSVDFTTYTLVPNLQPHTIGPGPPNPTFVVAQRPVRIENANIVLNNLSTFVRQPLNIRDDDWWANLRAYQIKGTLPIDLYYSPGWPNGSLFLWPVPTIAYLLELETWTSLSQVALTTKISLPPGYVDAIVYSLAVSLLPSFEKPLNPILVALAMKAIQRIQGPNTNSPRIGTRDWGMPQAGQVAQRPTFNYRTGRDRP